MKRRDFLQCAALLVSGMAAGRAGITLSAEQRHLMNAINYAATPVVFFTAQQRATVAAAAEQIIPCSPALEPACFPSVDSIAVKARELMSY